MKKFAKFFVSLILAISLTLHSFYLPAWANEYVEYREDGTYYRVDDCSLVPDPADYPSATTSLGLTLTAGQIAALIAGSVGVVYASTNWDTLATHLQTALNDAASTVSGGAEALLNWWNAAATGQINLSKATLAGDVWIVSTIVNALFNLHQGISSLFASPLGEYAPVEAGAIVPAGTLIYTGGLKFDSSGNVIRQAPYTFDFDTFVLPFTYYNNSTRTIYATYYIFKSDAGNTGTYTYSGTTNYFASYHNISYMTSSGGLKRYYIKTGGSFGLSAYDADIVEAAFNSHFAPGSFVCDSDPWSSSSSIAKQLFEQIMAGESIDGAIAMPGDVAVLPDICVGDISKAWTDEGLGSDVISLPDILIDGSDLITGDDAASIDTSISTALDKVATGELTWDDLWLDISGAKPEITVKDDAAEDVGGPITLPDWFVDFCDRVTGSADDRNDKIDSLLPGLGDGMASIDGFESDILDQFNNAFNDLDLDGFQLSSGILAALTWLVFWVVQFFNASGDLQVVILLPMLLGLALLFIGRGSMAMQRVEASHLKASLKKDGGGSS